MKRYWNIFKVLLVLVIAIGAIFWAAGSVRSLSYSRANLTFSVGNGSVTVTNPSNQPIPVQLVSAGSRSFTVSSAIEGMPRSSTKQGTGTTVSQLVEFTLPPGVSEFTVVHATNVTTPVNFVANTETKLEATAQPLNTNDTRTTIIVAVVVVFGALFYASRTTGHRWIGILRGQPAPVPILNPVVKSAADSQGQTIRSFGDNRADLSTESRAHQQ
jgi:preprotein translocase subunit SecE